MDDRHIDGFAELNWLSESEGGRKSVPTDQYYAANIRFEGNEQLWSVMIFFLGEAHEDLQKQVVGFSLFFHKNIMGELGVGKHIFIYEGPVMLVAVGKIISVND